MSHYEIHELFQKLPDIDFDDRRSVREKILSLARRLDSPDPLAVYLHSDSYLVREYAADAMGVINHEHGVQYLTDLLNNEQDQIVQMAAVYSLREIKSFSALEALLKIASNTEYPELVRTLAVQSTAVALLGTVINPLFDILHEAISTDNATMMDTLFEAFQIIDGHENAVPNRLLELMHSDQIPDYFFLWIIGYLGERRYAQAVDAISAFLESDDPDLRHASATALGNLGIPDVIPKLEVRLNVEDEYVKQRVELALQRLKGFVRWE